MSRALIVLAMLAPPAAPPRVATSRPALSLPAPPRTTPHRPLERVDKWQHDERTIA